MQTTTDNEIDFEMNNVMKMRRVPAVLPDLEAAAAAWGANCGPMSLAAVLGLPTVEAARPLVQPFRGFMTPTDMRAALANASRAQLVQSHCLRPEATQRTDPWPASGLGLVRIQWVGSWLDHGVDPRAAYRYTHWVGARRGLPKDDERGGGYDDDAVFIYDCNANAWLPLDVWAAWCPTLWPKRATGWRPATRIDVIRRTGR